MYRDQVGLALRKFGESLKPDESYYDEAKQLANQVFRKLRENFVSRDFTIAETIFFGSFGKRTDVIQPDLDLVIVINNCEPKDYERIVEQFDNILTYHGDVLRIRDYDKDSGIQASKRSVSFTFENGMEADLLPAANLTEEEVYSRLRRNPEDYYEYSTCLDKAGMEFIRSQGSFAHSLVRLLKFWYKMLHLKISGGKLMMELIAVASAMIEEARGEECMVRAFSDALVMISNIDSLKIIFKKDENANGNWRLVSERELQDWNSLVRNCNVGTHEILQRNAYIVEPGNPWNDLLNTAKPEALEKLKNASKFTWSRLQKCVNLYPGVEIFELFQPTPGYFIRVVQPSYKIPVFIVSSDEPTRSRFCDLKLRNEMPLQNPENAKFVEAMKWNLLARVNSLEHVNSAKNMRSEIGKWIEDSLQTELVPSRKSHESMDATITIPYQVGNQLKSVKFSVTFDN